MSYLFIWIYSGGGGVTFVKLSKREQKLWKFENLRTRPKTCTLLYLFHSIDRALALRRLYLMGRLLWSRHIGFKKHYNIGFECCLGLDVSSRFLSFALRRYRAWWCSCRWGETVSEVMPPTGLLFIPPDECRVLVEWYWQGKPKNSEKKLFQKHFVHQ
jgi:hypothetical protein